MTSPEQERWQDNIARLSELAGHFGLTIAGGQDTGGIRITYIPEESLLALLNRYEELEALATGPFRSFLHGLEGALVGIAPNGDAVNIVHEYLAALAAWQQGEGREK